MARAERMDVYGTRPAAARSRRWRRTMHTDGAAVQQAGETRSARVESLRAIAALAVLVSHAFAFSHHWNPVIFRGFVHRTVMGGGQGVLLFFALSGYLLY